MSNFLTICYKPCEPAPANGYKVQFRPSGSAEAFRPWPTNFFPTASELLTGRAAANLLVTADPDGTQYEGLVYGDCPAGLGVASPWTTGDNPPESDSGSSGASASASSSTPTEPCGAYDLVNFVDENVDISYTACDGTFTVVTVPGHTGVGICAQQAAPGEAIIGNPGGVNVIYSGPC